MTDEESAKLVTQMRAWPRAGFDLVSLRIVLAAAEERSFAGAAGRENTSLSAVSRRVAELEQRVGVALFTRHDRGVTPTEAGARFVDQLHEVFDRLEAIALDLEDFKRGVRGIVRMCAPLTVISGDLPSKVASFMTDHPGIDVQMVEATSAVAIHGVTVGDLDLAVVPATPQPGSLSFTPWFEDELVVILPGGHPLATRKALTIAALADEHFIGMQRDSGLATFYRQHVQAQGIVLKERAHTTSFESIRQFVSVGLGVAILPASAALPYADDLRLAIRTLDESWSRRQFYLCTREVERRSAATRLLIGHLTG